MSDVHLGIRESVKRGLIDPQEVLQNRGDLSPVIRGWLRRRLDRGLTAEQARTQWEAREKKAKESGRA